MSRLALLLLLAWTISCGGTAATAIPPTLPPASPATSPSAPTDSTADPATVAANPTADPTADPSTVAANPTATAPPDITLVLVGGAEIPVELAITPEQRSQGLSGRDDLPSGTGMLFIYEADGTHNFWMKDMNFPLDFVWISGECVVADVTPDVPPPEPGQAIGFLPTYSPSSPARYVLEINAGEAGAASIDPGDIVEFAGSLLETHGCGAG